ncbi:MAG: hypothetical protein CFK49_06255 [Armatimonadetes bacterium JP3_11]|nr:MAG: hypothetical protein CFK49_06255 [Armatimonadetes bacterium JP3_11]RMH09320.1 MAG: hypothetical protein D6697_03995 [Armatimonadota bacterium]
MPIIETVEQLAEFLEQNDEWRRKLFAILVPRSLQRMPEELDEFRDETRAEFKSVRQEIREGFERVDREFEKVRQEMREGFERVDREMREGFERQGAQIKKNTDDIAELKGISLEQKCRDQAGSWFSKYIRRARVITLSDLDGLLPEEQPLSEQEIDELSNTDLFVVGVDKRDRQERVYVVEVSWVVDKGDVERAVQRARVIAQHGVSTAAIAAGREITQGAHKRAQQLGCGLWINGQFQAEPMII